jgi:hypothetical protein
MCQLLQMDARIGANAAPRFVCPCLSIHPSVCCWPACLRPRGRAVTRPPFHFLADLSVCLRQCSISNNTSTCTSLKPIGYTQSYLACIIGGLSYSRGSDASSSANMAVGAEAAGGLETPDDFYAALEGLRNHFPEVRERVQCGICLSSPGPRRQLESRALAGRSKVVLGATPNWPFL